MKPTLVWTVGPEDGNRVADVVTKMRALGAPKRPRVFVNGRRAGLDELVDEGDVVELWPARDAGDEPERVRILAQRDGVLLVYKPVALPTETTRQGEGSLVSELIGLLNGGRVHAASRLDVGVSGVVVCTLGRNAALRVDRWRGAGRLRRTYLGLAAGELEDEGQWQQPLGTMRDRGGRHRSSPDAARTRPASTRYRVLARSSGVEPAACLLELQPETGRMHQLRVHAALAGAPLWGDRLYGGPGRVTEADGRVHQVARIGLHAWRVQAPSLSAESPPPDSWRQLAELLGLPVTPPDRPDAADAG